ncbi:MAG: pantoate--beta-alanine ligase [Gammaproteobacteria bacterium]|nr:MAG: pantoate--beta-alanine ligase [Gammaproteobacteria bacterium]
MQTVGEIKQIHKIIREQKVNGKKVAFVPTMGNLHAGHISLITKAVEAGDFVVSSVFVNPLQFCEGEDYGEYPRTLKEDQEKLKDAGCDLLFAPPVSEMYPRAKVTNVIAPAEITDTLCGLSRPGHFAGVTTVVTKLFGIVQPDIAVFGKKDFQQLAVIRRMTEDLSLPIEIIGMETVREADGLAMSSRNSFLSEPDRKTAIAISENLKKAKAQIESGNKDFAAIEKSGRAELESVGFVVDYFTVREQATLNNATIDDRKLVILVAAKLGSTRLIDNIDFVL